MQDNISQWPILNLLPMCTTDAGLSIGSCIDSNVQQTGLAQKDIPVVVLYTMALIETHDFRRVSSKRTGEIVNSCIDDLEIKAHML